MSMHQTRSAGRGGFSLVEVVLAIGLVAFALLTIVGMYGGMIRGVRDNADRREMLEAANALRTELNEQVGFETVFGWAKTNTGGKELLYVTYHADTNGAPQADAKTLKSAWIDPLAPSPPIADLDAARESGWLRARLKLAPSGNPGGITNLSSYANASNYPHALLVLQAEIVRVADPNLPFPQQSFFAIPVGVMR